MRICSAEEWNVGARGEYASAGDDSRVENGQHRHRPGQNQAEPGAYLLFRGSVWVRNRRLYASSQGILYMHQPLGQSTVQLSYHAVG